MRSKKDKESAILWCLARAPEGMYAADLSFITGRWIAFIYVQLAGLESAGIIHAVRDKGPYPQGYRYFLGRGKDYG